MKCLRNTAKYTWKDYKSSEDILSELKINLVVKAIQNYMKGHNMFGGWTETDRQTATLNCEISTMWETKPRTTPQKTS
jgi:hypothetical protein